MQAVWRERDAIYGMFGRVSDCRAEESTVTKEIRKRTKGKENKGKRKRKRKREMYSSDAKCLKNRGEKQYGLVQTVRLYRTLDVIQISR